MLTIQELADKLGKPKASLRLDLFRLDPELTEKVKSGQLTVSQAWELQQESLRKYIMCG